ncbi:MULTISPECIES: SigB/SigF/SigG family RNA polymerase sigma factor [unclassified Streptomyces]|uniref:SigB/SigF/SigG family RNA polymerase sigma factor n=1 Tax=Streptomyces sp. NBC_01443 TaxID=2903868 RepID=UPI00224FD313|nr:MULTISPECIES: SigB/SigF/SigG family RNA polymerase sigma factor [unclassified Streptomyces]MCX4632188.1 SigB/SigF/SigG family RNA polymerase sigma factor [Streptomyces sp. NBC_01443]WSW48001.1 SigB/SigF/SigG family RNA polymerase sigma factor [Streptomyces sp. NBC_01001]
MPATDAQITPAPTGTVGAPTQDVDLFQVENAREMAPADARELSKVFFGRLRSLEEGTREYQYARNTLIEMNLSLVQFAARRFRARTLGGSLDMDDIIQVGTIGLIKAIDRYDPERGVEFSTLALPYITGEIKRYFRDTTWAVHVPRRLQELRTELAKAREALTDVLGRAPTVKEVAQHLELTEEQVIDGLVAANGYTSGSLDTTVAEGDEPSTTSRTTRPLADQLGDLDPAMELFEEFHTLAPLLEQLDDRDRLILQMRFGQEKTQAEIGAELGITQMQVSRLLSRTLTRLRAGMLSA